MHSKGPRLPWLFGEMQNTMFESEGSGYLVAFGLDRLSSRRCLRFTLVCA